MVSRNVWFSVYDLFCLVAKCSHGDKHGVTVAMEAKCLSYGTIETIQLDSIGLI